jgi:hypothetical protein
LLIERWRRFTLILAEQHIILNSLYRSGNCWGLIFSRILFHPSWHWILEYCRYLSIFVAFSGKGHHEWTIWCCISRRDWRRSIFLRRSWCGILKWRTMCTAFPQQVSLHLGPAFDRPGNSRWFHGCCGISQERSRFKGSRALKELQVLARPSSRC